MATGLLEVSGMMPLDQFWFSGSSDADTAKVVIRNKNTAFRFKPHPAADFKVTRAFNNATVRGRTRNSAIKNVQGEDRITVRFQGMDAPELHFRPPALLTKANRTKEQHELYLEWNEEYRQKFGETATVKLKRLLESSGQDPLPCRVVTAVDEPDEVFDTYGRFVGNILVQINGREIDLNTWLVRQGLAFPAFYASMSRQEIETLIEATDEAWIHNRGIWNHFPDYIGRLNFDLHYRRPTSKPVFDPQEDSDDTIFPKLFRRLSTWAVGRKSKMTGSGFKRYLEDRPDHCFLTDEFLEQGPTASVPRRLDEFVDADGWFAVWPEQIVFQESSSRLTGPGGTDVTW